MSGSSAGTGCAVHRFPCQIGRSADNHLRLEDAGVWDKHLQIDLLEDATFRLTVHSPATAAVNGQFLESTTLRNGDVIEVGAAKVAFWIGPTRQRSVRFRELMTWISVAILCLIQVVIIYSFLP